MTQNGQKQTLLQRWYEAKQSLTAIAETERELRREICKIYFGVDSQTDLVKGTRRVDIDGAQVKAVFKINKTIDQSQVNKTCQTLQAMNTPVQIINEVFSWTAKLQDKGFKMLTPEQQAIVNEIVTEKPGMPSMDIETAKVKR